MSTTVSKTSVILRDYTNWDKWIELIKTASLKYDVWRYIDPSKPKDKLPVLVEPQRPTPANVHTPATTRESTQGTGTASSATTIPDPKVVRLSDLTPDEREYFRVLNEDYTFNRK